MDFGQNDSGMEPSQRQPLEPIGGINVDRPHIERASKATGWKMLLGIILALSVIANFVLVLALIGVVAIFAATPRGLYAEEVIREGPRSNKIAVVTLEGIIDGAQAKNLLSQLKMAERDRRVKAVIVQVDSPGGTLTGSDQIYHAIRKFRDSTGKPVIAFMQGIAASGGYYTSVACEKIMAEPTAITGSIGVIFGHFVLEELLQEKLGIQPVFLTSGPKKGWPSMFSAFTEQQREYVEEKLISPAYKRFVKIVADGRPLLTQVEVEELADGSIYGAEEAVQEKLIDKVGYFDDAVEWVKSLADIEKAQVVQYRRPFSFARFLTYQSRSSFKFDRNTLYELSTPQVLYLWTINQ
jgi:protease-4